MTVRQPMARVVAASRSGTLALALAAGVAVPVPGAAAADADDQGQPRTVVVTTDILGALVRELVGTAADVVVLMPRGANPHTWEPSARAVESLVEADLIISNGLDLEEGLVSVLESAAADGVPWFEAADHVALLQVDTPHEHEGGDGGEGAEDHDEDEGHAAGEVDDHDHGPTDPHIWTDPLTMAEVVSALVPVLAEAGIEVMAADLVAQLRALDASVADILAVVPPDDRLLVTGHRSLGYFARRYGFELVGSVIDSLSTDAEPTPRELAELIEEIRAHDVPAVFAEVGTPDTVAQAVAGDSGAELVELSAGGLPEDGSYADFITALATTIADALGGEG